jgi:tetratricopeptide (TPR) repeat protein
MTEREREALQLCEAGLQHMWKGDVDSAIEVYDRAAVIAASDETRELITIRKAEALIASEREGAEVAALPGIVMRRRSPRHVYMAATVLMRRFVEADDRRKAIFYGEIARSSVGEMNDSFARATVLNHLGITLVVDSQFASAIEVFTEAVQAITPLAEKAEDASILFAGIRANLGGAKVLSGACDEGIRLLEGAMSGLVEDYERTEALLDLCFGYMEIERYDISEMYGRRALELATVKRQIRNANHLLGEICLRTERYEEADGFFDVVAAYYPEFKNVKQLLVAVDLCAVVNWKA